MFADKANLVKTFQYFKCIRGSTEKFLTQPTFQNLTTFQHSLISGIFHTLHLVCDDLVGL